MKRLLTVLCLLAFTGTALAGMSIGFKIVEAPYYWSDYLYMEDMGMLRVGFMASPEFRIELLGGYTTFTEEEQEGQAIQTSDGSRWAIGGAGYYIIAAPANTQFSIGGQFIYGSSGYTSGNYKAPDVTFYSLSPLMRVDFAIPGAERFALFTEYGIQYRSASRELEVGTTTYSESSSEMRTYAPSNILAGAYYVF